jgi:iron complex outermembrane receptor protein
MTRFLWILFLLIPSLFQAQSTGQVLDGNSGNSVPYAYLYFPELNQGQQSDENGLFRYREFQSSGKLRVQVSAIGYESFVGYIDTEGVSVVIFLYPGHLTLREVVVAAPASALDGSSVMNVARIARSEMDAFVPVNLTEGLRLVPGVDMISTGTGIGKPVIRGMSGNRIATYLHGVRIENQQWGPDHGLGLGTLGVEAVEIIKGPASLLYGPDAIGGVLYLVDERFAESGTYSVFAESGFIHNSLGWRNQAGLRFSGNRFSMNLSGAYDNYADYAIPGGDRVLNTRFSGPSVNASLGYRGKGYISRIRYSFVDSRAGLPGVGHHDEEEHEEEGGQDEHAEEWFSDSVSRDRMLPDQRNKQHHLASEHTWFFDQSRLDLIAGWSANRRGEFEESRDTASLNLDLNTYSTDVRWTNDFSDRFSLITGARLMYQSNKNLGEERLIPDACQGNAGAYALIQQRVRKLLIQAGVRYDYNEFRSSDSTILFNEGAGDFVRNFNTFSYSGGLSTQLFGHTEMKFNLSGGYRAPNGYELSSNGIHHGAVRYELGNPDLKPESSLQADLALLYSDDHLEISIEPYASMISNYIFLEPTDQVVDEFAVFRYVNANAIMYGGESRVHWHPHFLHLLHIESSSSFVRGYGENGEDLPFIPPFRQSTLIRAELGDSEHVLKNVFLGHTWRSQQQHVATMELMTPEYHLFDAGASFQKTTGHSSVSLTIGVRNILDRRYMDHLSRLRALDIPNEGRRIFVSLRVDLKGNIRVSPEQ